MGSYHDSRVSVGSWARTVDTRRHSRLSETTSAGEDMGDLLSPSQAVLSVLCAHRDAERETAARQDADSIMPRSAFVE